MIPQPFSFPLYRSRSEAQPTFLICKNSDESPAAPKPPKFHPLGDAVTRLLRVLPLILLSLTATAAPFDEGIAAYEASEYTKAARHFQAALDREETAAARHNLALAQFQSGAAGKAVWQLERATRLDPYRAEYPFKLAALRQQLGLTAGAPEWYTLAARALSYAQWALGATLAFWLALAAWWLPRIGGIRAGLGIKAARAVCTVAFVLCLPALVLQARERARGAVVAGESVALTAAPAGSAPQTGSARTGERARILDQHRKFYKVETEAGVEGWLPAESFRPIYP